MRHGVGVGVPRALQHAVGDEGTHGVGAHRHRRGRRLHPEGTVNVGPARVVSENYARCSYRAISHLGAEASEHAVPF